jgi:ubiquinone/menaquinone biosynthesis C-methylase UbiE
MQEQVRIYFDSMAHSYASLYSGHSKASRFFNARKREVEALLADAATGSKILEVGCGPGLMVDYFLERRADYYGVDLSSEMVAECRTRFDGLASVHFCVGDVQRLEFSDSSFDIVLCLGALEYVAVESQAVGEMARVLKPGGTVILSAITKWSPFNTWERLVYRRMTRRGPGPIVQEYHTEEQFRKLLQTLGLEIVDISYFDFSLVVSPFHHGLPGVSMALSERLECLRRGRLRKLGNGFLVKCRASRKRGSLNTSAAAQANTRRQP